MPTSSNRPDPLARVFVEPHPAIYNPQGQKKRPDSVSHPGGTMTYAVFRGPRPSVAQESCSTSFSAPAWPWGNGIWITGRCSLPQLCSPRKGMFDWIEFFLVQQPRMLALLRLMTKLAYRGAIFIGVNYAQTDCFQFDFVGWFFRG